MARRRLEARGGLLADIQTAILTEPLDSVFHITGELGRLETCPDLHPALCLPVSL